MLQCVQHLAVWKQHKTFRRLLALELFSSCGHRLGCPLFWEGVFNMGWTECPLFWEGVFNLIGLNALGSI